MVAINFQPRFAPLVESGEKRQTIRKVSRHTPTKGGKLQLYTGQRQKDCRKLLAVDPVCVNVREVEIDCNNRTVSIEGEKLKRREATEFAIADGFESKKEMCDFFLSTYRQPVFHGVLIEWEAE